ncbi:MULTISPECIES: hypothetical protein [unclassified Streptomyces]|uniref:hypothetical protein n=1 Tax=unclassified Streptomyces TaxID=2593676 RepID=UPI0006FECBEC|nr:MULTISPECIES: hypothetical protein [unclassified Streptomyces]KQX59059.1 hypothetical protein ASD33_01790 [Streptomyces sp. Root1304]KRB00321.1 hypothetical protein ASE09_01790 [Streptomyces sp. Root66D1]
MRRTNGPKALVVAALVLTGLLSACGAREPDPEQAAAWREDYCTRLSAWQRFAHDPAVRDNDDDPGLMAAAVLSAAKVVDREHLDHEGSHVLDDTAQAVAHDDRDAEGRVSAYCSAVGFETLMKY